ncbi:MAG: S1/P1 nuclease [Longimicrobiaceae bacterium]
MRRLIAALLLCAGVAFPATARAWNRPGHMLTGALAYYQLRERDPAAIPRIIDLLRHHQAWQAWVDSMNAHSVPPQDRDLVAFMYAARFPDDFKSMPGYNASQFSPQHYVDFPFKPAEQPSSVHTQPPEPINLLGAMREHLDVLHDPHATPAARAFALSFVFHLTGDVHQPLHAAQLFTTDFPNGDEGGNRVWVTVPSDSRPWKLHALWDDIVIRSYGFGQIASAARLLLSQPAMRRATFPELGVHNVTRWAQFESYPLAVHRAYLDGALEYGTSEATARPVPSGYLSRARATADRRMVLAGYRLADLLRAHF